MTEALRVCTHRDNLGTMCGRWADAGDRCGVHAAVLTRTPSPSAQPVAPLDEFAQWFAEQVPAGTIISSPAWWAPRIYRAIVRAPAPSAQPDAVRQGGQIVLNALADLSGAVLALAPYFDAPITDDTIGKWEHLNAAQSRARAVVKHCRESAAALASSTVALEGKT